MSQQARPSAGPDAKRDTQHCAASAARFAMGFGALSPILRATRVRRSLNLRGRRSSKFRRRTGPAFQGSSSGASIVGCHASALARIFVDRSDAAAGLYALAVVIGADVSVVLA